MRSIVRKVFGLGVLVVTLSCGDVVDGLTPPGVNTLGKNAGDGQVAVVGEAAPIAPSVKVTNQNGQAVPGIVVTFAVASGSGQVTGSTATTNPSGVATVGSWTMGTTVGANTLTAAATGLSGSPVTFTATANAGAPKNLTKQAGDNQTTSPSEFVAVKPSVKVTDQYANPVAGVAVSFAIASGGGTLDGGGATTGADGIATLRDWKLGPNQGANTLTATVIGITGITGSPATFTATGQYVAFSPTANTAISGDKTYGSVNIPAGVTVTINTDAVITVAGDYSQAGVITAPCHTLRINATGILTATGNISNTCTDPAVDGRDLVLIGQGGYNISNNEIDSSGDIWIMDGPTLALPSVAARPAVRRMAPPNVAEAGPYRCRLVNMTLKATPLTRNKAASASPKGDDGKPGTSRTSGCGQLLTGQSGGNMLIDGITMIGGSGGEGGDGTTSSSTPSIGGDGGPPGALNLVSDGDIDIQGNVTIITGNGGKGGNAISTANTAGASATATGGKGSGLTPKVFPSPVRISSAHGTVTVNGTVRVVFGNGGAGGNANATGGAGAPGAPGQKGGDATATGGRGGDVEPWSLLTGPGVAILGQVRTDSGGNGGAGGLSTKNPGTGGAGNVPGASGGVGGNAFGRSGDGGNGRVASGPSGGKGGAAGGSTYSGGKGGDGLPKCPPTGGAGGKGGDASGGAGVPGNGSAAGAAGTVAINNFGNGGNGMPGNGAGGGGGTNSVAGATVTASFQPGLAGGPCPPTQVSLKLEASTPSMNDGLVASITRVTPLVDQADMNTVVGQIEIEAVTGPNYYGSSPFRLGWGGLAAWILRLNSATVLGQRWIFTAFTVCLLNSVVNATNPVFAEQLNAAGQVIATTLLTQLACVNIQVLAAAYAIRLRGTGSGSSADANGFGGPGMQVPAVQMRPSPPPP